VEFGSWWQFKDGKEEVRATRKKKTSMAQGSHKSPQWW
jgi:hypothetical protein